MGVFMYLVLHIVGTSEEAQITHALKYIFLLQKCTFWGIFFHLSSVRSNVSGLETFEGARISHALNSAFILIYW